MRVAELAPADYNPRKISARAADGLRASLARFGELGGIVWNERTRRLVGGHQRVKALLALGVEEVDVRVVDLPVAEEKALNVTLNNPAISGEFDFEVLDVVLDDIRAELPNAFEELHLDDIRPLFAPSTGGDSSAGPGHGGGSDAEATSSHNESQNLIKGLTDPDETPEPAPEPVTRVGDVWVLGDHRIICGDSTDAATVALLLAGAKPHLMVTDPPYGVEYDANWRNEAKRPDGTPYGATALGVVKNDDRADWREAWALFPGDVAYVWHSGTMAHVVAESLIATGFGIRAQVVWGKSSLVISRGHYHPQHEPCWYAVRKGGTGHWQGDRTQSTLWAIDKPRKSETGHSTQKPIECMLRPILNNSAKGDAVYEPFSGSGTTIIAGEQSGRRVYAVELNPPYVDIAVRRWQAFTGKQAVLDGDGRTFDDIAVDRGVEAAGGTRG